MTYSHMAEATLPSAQNVFTSEFGMGSGGSRSLMPSGKKVPDSFAFDACRVRQSESNHAVHSTIERSNRLRLYGRASRAISTGSLSALLRVHTQPINQVVFLGPLGGSSPQGDLVLGGASRLDAFSGYPVCI